MSTADTCGIGARSYSITADSRSPNVISGICGIPYLLGAGTVLGVGFWAGRTLGAWVSPLAIIDPSDAANQPMSNDGSIWVVYNGEIYNHAEIRRN